MTRLSDLSAQQPHATQALATAVRSGRLHHAYILAGPPEANADRLALAVAQSLVCQSRSDVDACETCPGCRKLLSGSHPDFLRVEPDDKGNIAIDAIRLLTGRLALKAAESPHKVAYLRDADQMNPAAQNALLKTLEEPPGSSIFLLTTTRWRSLLPTVRSRSLTLRLAPLTRQGATQALIQAGIPEQSAQPLAALVGSDVERAQAMLANGADEIIVTLTGALAPTATIDAILKVAADLGAERERADLALTLLEVGVRDALAARHGANTDQVYVSPLWLAPHAEHFPERLVATGRRLQQLRRAKAMNPNRTLSLEGILLLLAGKLGAEPSLPTGSSRFA